VFRAAIDDKFAFKPKVETPLFDPDRAGKIETAPAPEPDVIAFLSALP